MPPLATGLAPGLRRRGRRAAALVLATVTCLALLPVAALRAEITVGPLMDVDVDPTDGLWNAIATAYDPINNRFLALGSDWSAPPDLPYDIYLYARLINANGTHHGDMIPICTRTNSQHMAGSAVFDPVQQRYLVVWGDNRVGFWQTYGRFLNADGSYGSDEFRISPADEWWSPGTLLYDSANQRFFLVMTPEIYPYNVYVQIVNADGSLPGPPRQITFFTEGYGTWNATAAYDSNHQRFLVAYGVEYYTYETRARVLNGDGSPYSGEITLASQLHRVTSAAFDPINSRFLVMWDPRNESRTHGRIVNADGGLFGEPLIVTDGYYEGNFGVVFEAISQKFLVTGFAYSAAPSFDGFFAQLLNLNGSRLGPPAPVEVANAYAIAYCPAANGSLLAWLGSAASGFDVFARQVQVNLAPDLAGDWTIFMSRRVNGVSQVKGTLTVTNHGDESTGAFKVGYYLSPNAVWDTQDKLVRTVTAPSLAPGASINITFQAGTTVNLTGKYLIARIDAANQVQESDETNNTTVSPAILGAP